MAQNISTLKDDSVNAYNYLKSVFTPLVAYDYLKNISKTFAPKDKSNPYYLVSGPYPYVPAMQARQALDAVKKKPDTSQKKTAVEDAKPDTTAVDEYYKKLIEAFNASKADEDSKIQELLSIINQNKSNRSNDIAFLKDQIRTFNPSDISDENISQLKAFAEDMVANKENAVAFNMMSTVATGAPIDSNLLSSASSVKIIRDRKSVV